MVKCTLPTLICRFASLPGNDLVEPDQDCQGQPEEEGDDGQEVHLHCIVHTTCIIPYMHFTVHIICAALHCTLYMYFTVHSIWTVMYNRDA